MCAVWPTKVKAQNFREQNGGLAIHIGAFGMLRDCLCAISGPGLCVYLKYLKRSDHKGSVITRMPLRCGIAISEYM